MSSSRLSSLCFVHSIDKLLGTNQVPSPAKKRQIMDSLIDPEEELQEMRAEIEKMEKQLKNLILREETLSLEVEPYQALLSPFRRMPDDILGQIFIWCLPNEHTPVIDIRQPPLLLTQISSRLRQVALSTPRLWAAISIPIVLPCFPEWHDGRNESRASISERIMLKYTMAVNEWLGRTGVCDVEIFVHEFGGGVVHAFGNTNADRHIEGLFKILIALAARWKSISLHCSGYSIQKFCAMLGQSYLQSDFPRLERLSLSISDLCFVLDDPPEIFNASQLPHALNLRNVRLVMPEDNYDEYRFQWSHLTCLSLGSESYPAYLNSIVEILKTCTNLLNCKLYIKMESTDLRLCLPYLKAISFFFDQEAWFNHSLYSHDMREQASSLFDHLDAPLLERITYDASTNFFPLLGLLQRMGNNITHLSVTHFEIPTELIHCLKACPLLVALNVSRPGGIPNCAYRQYEWSPAPWVRSLRSWATAGDQLLRYLMTVGDVDEMIPAQLCPHLEHLAYHISDGPMSYEAIEAFIFDKCSRRSARLKGLSVSIHGGMQIIQFLRHSVEEQLLDGLHLHLSPCETTSYKLMEHSTHPSMRQPKWWDEEGNIEARR